MLTGARQRIRVSETARCKCKHTVHMPRGAGPLEALQLGMAGAPASNPVTAACPHGGRAHSSRQLSFVASLFVPSGACFRQDFLLQGAEHKKSEQKA